MLLTAAAGPAQITATLGSDRNTPELVAVRGDTELSSAAAFESARVRAEDMLRERWQGRADRIATAMRPVWLPSVLYEQAARRWLYGLPLERNLKILDREDREREHDLGTSWQTTLWVAEDPRGVADGERAFRGELKRVEQRTLARAGITMGFWVALGLALAWVDRLSRGYMTGRLRLLGILLATAVPAILFLL
jgi:hypothetical protein